MIKAYLKGGDYNKTMRRISSELPYLYLPQRTCKQYESCETCETCDKSNDIKVTLKYRLHGYDSTRDAWVYKYQHAIVESGGIGGMNENRTK